jgi:hypothetical protein
MTVSCDCQAHKPWGTADAHCETWPVTVTPPSTNTPDGPTNMMVVTRLDPDAWPGRQCYSMHIGESNDLPCKGIGRPLELSSSGRRLWVPPGHRSSSVTNLVTIRRLPYYPEYNATSPLPPPPSNHCFWEKMGRLILGSLRINMKKMIYEFYYF